MTNETERSRAARGGHVTAFADDPHARQTNVKTFERETAERTRDEPRRRSDDAPTHVRPLEVQFRLERRLRDVVRDYDDVERLGRTSDGAQNAAGFFAERIASMASRTIVEGNLTEDDVVATYRGLLRAVHTVLGERAGAGTYLPMRALLDFAHWNCVSLDDAAETMRAAIVVVFSKQRVADVGQSDVSRMILDVVESFIQIAEALESTLGETGDLTLVFLRRLPSSSTIHENLMALKSFEGAARLSAAFSSTPLDSLLAVVDDFLLDAVELPYHRLTSDGIIAAMKKAARLPSSTSLTTVLEVYVDNHRRTLTQ